MTDARVQEEALAAGMSVHDMRKRPIWLTENGQALHATSELEQIGDLAQSATKRMKRAVRRQKMMYAKRVFSKAHENFDVPHWRPQSVTQQADSRRQLQGAMMPVDPASWQRYNTIRNTPQLTLDAQRPEWLSRPMVRPKPSASHAGSSTDGRILPGTLPKSRASAYFVMELKSKACPPVNPIHFQHDQDETDTDESAPVWSRTPTEEAAAQAWTPGSSPQPSRNSRRPRRGSSSEGIRPSVYERQQREELWSPGDPAISPPRSRSRTPRGFRHLRPPAWPAAEEGSEDEVEADARLRRKRKRSVSL
jgi:hypothetical protein